MSRAAEFVQTLNSDPELQSQLSSASSSAEAKKIVSDAGYGDVHSADIQALSNGSDELSDSELASASGAGGGGFSVPGFSMSFSI